MKSLTFVFITGLFICALMVNSGNARIEDHGSLKAKKDQAALVSSLRRTNLCFNGSFDHTNHPLEGWNYNYSWDGNKNYASNHKAIKVLKEHKGHKTVCSIGPRYWTKIDSRPIQYNQGKRLVCTMDITGGSATRIFFNGWKWKPGVRPNSAPKLGELRMSYKSKPKLGGGGGGWKRIQFQIPGFDKQSDLAMKSLRYVRWVTVHCITKGTLCIDNVEVKEVVWADARTYQPKNYIKSGQQQPEKKKPSFLKKIQMK